MTSQNYMRISVAGDTNSGKTSFITRYLYGTFAPNYVATTDTKYYKQCKNVNILEYININWRTYAFLNWTKYSRGVIIVYDIHNEDSYHNVNNWIREAKRYGGEHIPIIICGTKSDISDGEIYKYEYEDDKIKTFIVSAKTGETVNEAFSYLLDQINKQDIERTKQQPKDINISQPIDTQKNLCVLM